MFDILRDSYESRRLDELGEHLLLPMGDVVEIPVTFASKDVGDELAGEQRDADPPSLRPTEESL